MYANMHTRSNTTSTTHGLPTAASIAEALKTARRGEVTIVSLNLQRNTWHVYNRERGVTSFAVFNGLQLEFRVSPKDTGRAFAAFLVEQYPLVAEVLATFTTREVNGRTMADHTDDEAWEAREALTMATEDRRVALEVG